MTTLAAEEVRLDVAPAAPAARTGGTTFTPQDRLAALPLRSTRSPLLMQVIGLTDPPIVDLGGDPLPLDLALRNRDAGTESRVPAAVTEGTSSGPPSRP